MDAHSQNYIFQHISVDSIFPPNLSMQNISLRKLPIFYEEMVNIWIAISQSNPKSISLILSQSLWYNSFIKIDAKPLSPSFLCLKQPLFLKDVFDTNGAFLAWDVFAHKFNLTQDFYFKWFQIKSSIPRSWVKIISDNKTSDICHLSPHLNSGERIICIKKLTSTELYKLLIKN